ncbi:Pyridine nucleotide-disulfide oxidoreductase-like protein [Rasamsonia emersonii CBS 393.64]|uniref:Pyridine nucleotide-disulfide oxidoreductase-like protein n=1 Tax=Rasamsonia emersonii (strain ATCC 16479 / CBS 393.64 / IMI 116815) TaxID=1408163 RepID=A0A0F4YUG1_RASE3|nr:Pyridine nucleotide-disulfide oxidoreductase-like protein [Rasamsonia emersonii CBS 393.64]KKA21258.1 Pyridine nucleotide-disulfide oxidoreductase-like protein [Rasamsonia emersonii CBS 393.64]
MTPPVPPHILVVGAAYSGLYAVLNLLNICDGKPHFPSVMNLSPIRKPDVPPQITIVDERDGIFHTMGTPLVHVENKVTESAWIRYSDIPALKRANVHILQGRVVEIDPLRKCAFWRSSAASENDPDRVLQYDYLIAATGLQRDWPILPRCFTRQQYILDAKEHIAKLKATRNHPIVVIGGGAVGTEFAAEIKHHYPDHRVILIHSRASLLSNEPLPEEFKEKALATLKAEGVEVMLETRVMNETTQTAPDGESQEIRLKLSNGDEIIAGHTIWATSRHLPRTEFLPPESLNEEGYVKVLPSLQFAATIPNNHVHFAVGDIAAWSGIKRVGRALSMGQCAAVNILKLITADVTPVVKQSNSSNSSSSSREGEAGDIDGPELQVYPYVPPMIALALGSTAVTYHPDMGVSGGEEAYKTSFGTDLGLSIR